LYGCIAVITVNDPLTLNPNPAMSTIGSAFLLDLLTGATDLEGDSFSVTSTTTPAHDTLQQFNGKWLYTPTDLTYSGQD
jgi:hypothetical protein